VSGQRGAEEGEDADRDPDGDPRQAIEPALVEAHRDEHAFPPCRSCSTTARAPSTSRRGVARCTPCMPISGGAGVVEVGKGSEEGDSPGPSESSRRGLPRTYDRLVQLAELQAAGIAAIDDIRRSAHERGLDRLSRAAIGLRDPISPALWQEAGLILHSGASTRSPVGESGVLPHLAHTEGLRRGRRSLGSTSPFVHRSRGGNPAQVGIWSASLEADERTSSSTQRWWRAAGGTWPASSTTRRASGW
jgi:hypothetical protein